MNTPISFELAKLLKEKGFDKSCEGKYLDRVYYRIAFGKAATEKYQDRLLQAPTIAEVVMWLYEKHGIWIISSYELNIETHKKEWFWIAIKDGKEIAYQYIHFNSPTEAYQAAIEYVLNNLV